MAGVASEPVRSFLFSYTKTYSSRIHHSNPLFDNGVVGVYICFSLLILAVPVGDGAVLVLL